MHSNQLLHFQPFYHHASESLNALQNARCLNMSLKQSRRLNASSGQCITFNNRGNLFVRLSCLAAYLLSQDIFIYLFSSDCICVFHSCYVQVLSTRHALQFSTNRQQIPTIHFEEACTWGLNCILNFTSCNDIFSRIYQSLLYVYGFHCVVSIMISQFSVMLQAQNSHCFSLK